MRLCLTCRGNHVGIIGPFTSIKDVFANRAVQQTAFLLDHPNFVAQAVLGDLRNILTIDQDLTRFIIEPQQ